MADDKKDSKPSTDTGGMYFFTFIVLIFVIWVISGGPARDRANKDNQFNNIAGETYHENFFGQPGSVTNTIPFLK